MASTRNAALLAAAHSAQQSGSSVDALRELFFSSCAAYEPPGPNTEPAIELCVAPPEAHLEYSHENALGFMFADEMKVVRQLQKKHEHGEELFMKIYFARGCASAIPPPPPVATEASEVAKLLRYYGGVFEVLQPQVAKLRLLCDYCHQTVGLLSDTIQRIAAQENTHRVIPDVLLDRILDVMDIVLQMNQLHDTKSSLRNDFSLFKRAFKHVKGDISEPDNVAKEIQRLQEFVGNTAQSKSSIWDSLRHNLTSVKRYDQVVFLLVKQCLEHLEADRCLLPRDKFKFIRVLPCLMAVLNADPTGGNVNGFSSAGKKLIEATGKVVGRFPVVPVFADLCVKPMAPIYELSGVKQQEPSLALERQWDAAYDLSTTVRRARKDCADFLPRLIFAVNKARKAGARGITDATATSVAQLTSDAMRCLCDWKTSLQLFLSSKYQRPKTDDQLEHMGVSLDSPWLEYQRVITHNFEPDECAAIMDIIHTIKAVAHTLTQHSVEVTACIRAHVYSHVQQFVQHTLMPILHRADKKKHASLKHFHELRLLCGDWIRDECPKDDFKKRRRERQLPDLKRRSTPPTKSQLDMLRTAVSAIYARRTSGELEAKVSIFAFHRELKSSDIDTLQQFYLQSAEFAILLDYEKTVDELSALPELLFREVFLEIAKSPQLPVDDSLPWLVLKRGVMEGQGRFQASPVFSLLELYGDAANCALRQAEQAFVYNEVLAEAKLFFDHLVYVIADFVYGTAKSEAARAFIGGECLLRLQASTAGGDAAASSAVSSSLTDLRTISAMRRITVLDEVCDVRLLVGGHLNVRFMRDLGSIVNKMVRTDATMFVATVDLIRVLRTCHEQLSEFFVLDSFELMWAEASSSTKTSTSSHRREQESLGKAGPTRLQRMASSAITQDLAVNFGYNARTRRFFRTPLPMELRSGAAKARSVEVAGRSLSSDQALASSRKLLDGVGLDRDSRVGFEVMHQPYRSFIGLTHMEAMVSLLSEADIVDLVEDCVDTITCQIEEVMHLFVPVLGAAIPPYRHPKLLYRTEGCYGFFDSKFKHMMDSKELEVHVFHCLRLIGNTLLAVQLITQVMATRTADSNLDTSTTQKDLFVHVLRRLDAFLHDTELVKQWGADQDTNPEELDKNPSAFYLVWNALEYLSCCPVGQGNSACYREIFGEGVYFAGYTLVHLLHQRSLYDLWNPSQYVIDAHHHDETKRTAAASMQQATRGRKQSASIAASSSVLHNPETVGTLDPEMLDNTRRFVAHATEMRRSSAQFFATLESVWPTGSPLQDPAARRRGEFTPPQ